MNEIHKKRSYLYINNVFILDLYIHLKIIAKAIREYYLNFYMVDNKDWDK